MNKKTREIAENKNKLEIDEKKPREKSGNKRKLVKDNPSLEFFFSFQDLWRLNRNCDHCRDFRGEFTVRTRRDFRGAQFNSQEWVHWDFSPIFQIWILWWLGLDSLAVWTAAFARGLEFSKIFQEAQVLDFWARGLDRSVASAEYETKNEEFAIFKKLKLFPEFCPVLAIYFRWEPCIYLIYLFLFRLDAFLGSVFWKIAKNHKKPQPSHQSQTCPLVPRGISSLFKRKSPCAQATRRKLVTSPVSLPVFIVFVYIVYMTWMKLELQKNRKTFLLFDHFWPGFDFFSLTKFRNSHLPRIHGRKWSKVLVLFMAKLKLPRRAVEFFFHPTCFVQPPNAVVSKVFQGFGLGLGWPSLQDWYNVLFQLREQVEKRDCGSQTENSGFIFARK